MTSLAERIYFRSPRTVQHLLVSLKGLQLELQRRQGRYGEFRREIAARNHYSSEEFVRYQTERLARVLQHAGEEVPHYRESFRQAGVGKTQLRTLEELARFPLLDKQLVKTRPESFIPDGLPRRSLLRLNTTGTTGSPMTVYSTHVARQENYAHFDNFFELAGLDPKARRAIFGGKILQPGDDERPPFWRRSLFQNAQLFSSYHMREATLPLYQAELLRYRPAILEGYPSSLFRMARFLEDRGVSFPVQGIVTSSETLLDEQRQLIESVFACRVYDQYGAAEMCVFVGQCRNGRYHVRPDYCVMEILSNGRPAGPGEEGEVVCTGFLNQGMPLIRYRIGDIAAWAGTACDCGLAAPVLERVLGRKDDVIVTPDGRQIGRLSPVLKGFPVREAQYLQSPDGRLTVLLVPEGEFGADLLHQVEIELRKRVGPDIPVEFRLVDSIPRGPGGKFRAVISQYRG